jgi:hypothetical protein
MQHPGSELPPSMARKPNPEGHLFIFADPPVCAIGVFPRFDHGRVAEPQGDKPFSYLISPDIR